MRRGKRLLSFLLVCVMLFSLALQCHATEINKTREKGEKLKEQKEEAEQLKSDLAKQLNGLLDEMEALENKISAKEEELFAKEEELMSAQVEENNQYESMKKRIKYMYENGNAQLIEILFESENIGDFLNKAEYISTISAYDRDMLKVFQEVTKEVKEQEKVIRAEYEEMEEMQNQLITKQNELETMMKDKADEIAELESAIKKNAKKLEKLQKAAEDALRKQQESVNNPGSAGASVVAGNGYFTHPCPGYSRISSSFGWREQPLPGASTNHKGVDYAAPTGTPIYAAAAGTVTTAAYSGNAGKLIVINHGDGKVTKYMHCNAMYVSAGQKVSKGQHIAAVGTTGNSTGPHLHFQLEIGGVPKNPVNYY